MNEQIIQMIPAENLPFLMGIYRWGIEIIKVIQRIENPALTALVKFITALGTESLYVPLILFIFWWIDEKQGLRFGILIIVSAWINAFVKVILKQPRPYNLEPSLGLAAESSYGAPSGHAQMSLTFWISMAAWVSNKWTAKINAVQIPKKQNRMNAIIWACAVFMILLIGFTRLYLGVHFPTDLLVGWILGGIILVIWFIPGPSLEKLFASAGMRFQNICAAAMALVMNGLYPRDRSLPALFLGFCLGYTIMRKYFPFSARGEINGKKPGILSMFVRCFMGFLGMVVIYMALRLILPGEGSLFSGIPIWGVASPFYEIGRFIRYSLIGLWASAGAPRVFLRMGLASAPAETTGTSVNGNSANNQGEGS